MIMKNRMKRVAARVTRTVMAIVRVAATIIMTITMAGTGKDAVTAMSMNTIMITTVSAAAAVMTTTTTMRTRCFPAGGWRMWGGVRERNWRRSWTNWPTAMPTGIF